MSCHVGNGEKNHNRTDWNYCKLVIANFHQPATLLQSTCSHSPEQLFQTFLILLKPPTTLPLLSLPLADGIVSNIGIILKRLLCNQHLIKTAISKVTNDLHVIKKMIMPQSSIYLISQKDPIHSQFPKTPFSYNIIISKFLSI